MELRSTTTTSTPTTATATSSRLLTARRLLNRALTEVPRKMRASVFVDCSRLEEYAGHTATARALLRRAQSECKYEWKVFLESVLVEMRAGLWSAAKREAVSALRVHSGTGRLWAVLLQLMQREGEEEQMKVFQEAIREVCGVCDV